MVLLPACMVRAIGPWSSMLFEFKMFPDAKIFLLVNLLLVEPVLSAKLPLSTGAVHGASN